MNEFNCEWMLWSVLINMHCMYRKPVNFTTIAFILCFCFSSKLGTSMYIQFFEKRRQTLRRYHLRCQLSSISAVFSHNYVPERGHSSIEKELKTIFEVSSDEQTSGASILSFLSGYTTHNDHGNAANLFAFSQFIR